MFLAKGILLQSCPSHSCMVVSRYFCFLACSVLNWRNGRTNLEVLHMLCGLPFDLVSEAFAFTSFQGVVACFFFWFS